MYMNNRVLIALLATTLLSVSLYAKSLTLKEAVEKALKNHPDIKNLILKVERSKEGLKSVRSDKLPQITLQAQYNPLQTFALPVNGKFHTIDDNSWSVGVFAKDRIWDFSHTESKVEAAKLDKVVSEISLKEAKALLAFRIKSLYRSMLLYKATIDVQKEDLVRKEAYFMQAKALRAQGLKTKADESRFLAEVYSAKERLINAQADFEKARNSLSLYIGEPIPPDVKLQTGALFSDSQADTLLKDDIIAHNPSLEIEKLNIEKNRLLHKAAKASKFGSIDATAYIQRQETLNSYNSKFIGLSISIPIYTGGKLSSEEQRAKIASNIAAAQRESKKIDLEEEITSLKLDITRYMQSLVAKEAQLAATIESAKVVEARYKEGLATYIQLLDAATEELQSRLAILQAHFNIAVAQDRIRYLEGEIE